LLRKKVLATMLTLILAVSLAACGSGSNSAPAASSSGSSSATSSSSASGGAASEAPKSNYPEKAITFLVPSGAGGGIATMPTTIAKVLSDLNLVTQPITVENKPGGGQVVGTTEFALKDVGNDYKLMITSTPFVLNYIKKEGTATISFRDVTPLARMQMDYEGLAVRADSKYQTLQDLLDDLKADPSQVTFVGGGAPGTLDHLNSVLVADKIGVDISKLKYVA